MKMKNVFCRVLAACLTLGVLFALTLAFASCGGNNGWEFEETPSMMSQWNQSA